MSAHPTAGRRREVAGLLVTDHVLDLPLDHDDPTSGTIEVFAREVAAPGGLDRPLLVFLQGGPGHEAPRPTGFPAGPAWLERALVDHRVLMLDQRGTGNSTPYGAPSAEAATDAAYLRHFRADAIVRDAEAFRQHLGEERVTLLGQSFGGFCTLHYLSSAPESVRAAIFTGGLPVVGREVDDVYTATFDQMRRLDALHHHRYPEDRDRLARVLDLCDDGELRDPNGEPLTRRLVRTIGNRLGFNGGDEELHYLLERDPRSPAFTHDLVAMLPFGARNPMYAVIHESSYADGVATRWAAERVQPADFAADDSLLLTGEHLFRWHFEDTPGLRPYAALADLLAEEQWPRLFDPAVLAEIDVPAAAVVYAEDPFVERGLSLETAAMVPSLRTWVTDEYLHGGLRHGGGDLLDRLLGMTKAPVALQDERRSTSATTTR
jgi:pimeloyl-ACP methyl ester carboxylesterase